MSLILLPGLDGTGDLFGPIVGLDWGGVVPVILPLPQSGPQDYESLADALLTKLPEGQLVLLAESFSTPLALLLANRLGNRVSALVLAAGFCSAPHAPGLGWLPLRPLFSVTPPAFFLRKFLTGEDTDADLLDTLTGALRRTPASVMAERLRVVLALREQDSPSTGTTPILLLQASEDRIIPWTAQSSLERHLPDATVEWIEGPHLLLQARPTECHDAILRFLDTAGG
ncbi:MAG: alpha/beta hydrolase [Verrucomicrobia bacterium]|nr:alpha/beta hydrolase [Verrucomicrobiota bacterium]